TSTISPSDSAISAATPTRRARLEAPDRCGSRIAGAAGVLFERAGDHETLDLVGALVDLCDLGVAHHPLYRVLLDITVAAQDLNRLDGHGHRRVRAEDLRHRRVLGAIAVVLIGHRAGLVEQLAAGGRARFHVGQLELDRLELV